MANTILLRCTKAETIKICYEAIGLRQETKSERLNLGREAVDLSHMVTMCRLYHYQATGRNVV